MLHKRIIPVLLLKDGSLIKTRRFKGKNYIGDPCNTVKIFNELNADELIVLDIGKSKAGTPPDFDLVSSIAKECFMPLTYGGGITSVEDAKKLFRSGVEKISINAANFTNDHFGQILANEFGSQALVGGIDLKKDIFGKTRIWNHAQNSFFSYEPKSYVQKLEKMGFGELFITSVDNEGTWAGAAIDLIGPLAESVGIPCILNGGINDIDNIFAALDSSASAVGVSSLFIYQKKNFGVLVNIPDEIQNYS